MSLPVAGRTSPTVTSAAAVAMTPAPRWQRFCGTVVQGCELCLLSLEECPRAGWPRCAIVASLLTPIRVSERVMIQDPQCCATHLERDHEAAGSDPSGCGGSSTADRRSGPPPAHGRWPSVRSGRRRHSGGKLQSGSCGRRRASIARPVRRARSGTPPPSCASEANHSSFGGLGQDRVGLRHALADESCRHDRGQRIEQVEKGEW